MQHTKTTMVRELRNNSAQVIRWVGKDEEVEVKPRGKVVAKVAPPAARATAVRATAVDRAQSAAHNRPVWCKTMTAKKSAAVLADGQGF